MQEARNCSTNYNQGKQKDPFEHHGSYNKDYNYFSRYKYSSVELFKDINRWTLKWLLDYVDYPGIEQRKNHFPDFEQRNWSYISTKLGDSLHHTLLLPQHGTRLFQRVPDTEWPHFAAVPKSS
jgi:hypothetical protein